jgi:hypothetical protein
MTKEKAPPKIIGGAQIESLRMKEASRHHSIF